MTTRSTTRFARRAATLGIVALLAAALSGCVPFGLLPNTSGDTSTPAPESVSSDLKPFYTQTLQWTSCASGMQCATAKAPLDWNQPGAGDVKLALIRQKAKGTKQGSLLVNPGGPGGSGYDFVKDSVDYATDAKLQNHFDIVGFDPRGVGRSSAVKCYDAAKMDDYLYGLASAPRGSDAWIAEATRQSTAFGQACAANTGKLLGEVDTTSAARDLDLLRAVLGDRTLNYLGYSYGTFLGATYAKLYPEKTGRLVLDGALDPSSSNFEVTKVQAEGFESAMRAYLKDCLSGQNCPFSGSVDHGMDTIGQLLDAVDASPLRNSDGRELGANTLFTAIIYPLYDSRAWPQLSQMFETVFAGRAAGAFALADAYNGRNSDGTYSDNSTEAFTAINCLDYRYDADPTVMRQQAAELAQAAPTIGKYFAYGDIGCSSWPDKSDVTREPIHAKGAAPIIVVGTTNDPATPYVWAKSLAAQLDSGHLVTYTGEGHTAYNKSNSCVNDAVDDYLVDGTVPKTDPQC